MKRTFWAVVAAAATMLCASLVAQSSAPDIAFDSADILTMPDGLYLGEVAGVATNTKGHVFVYTRTGHPYATLGDSRTFYHGGSRLFEFDQTGKFVKEIGQGLYGFNAAQGLRIDPQDNIWAVDAGSSQVMKFDPDGRAAQLVFGRKPENIGVAPRGAPGGGGTGGGAGAGRAGGRGAPGAGPQGAGLSRPSDVTWDKAGNIYLADGLGNDSRVSKFDKDGHFLKSFGQTGSGPGEFNKVHGIAIDAAGLLYVADAGNKRIQVLDADGNFKREFAGIGVPQAICITPGAHQYLYVSDSNDPETLDNGEIYKVELDGRIAGKFGKAGKLPKEFGMVNALDCRGENELLVGEMTNWRVQKITLHPR